MLLVRLEEEAGTCDIRITIEGEGGWRMQCNAYCAVGLRCPHKSSWASEGSRAAGEAVKCLLRCSTQVILHYPPALSTKKDSEDESSPDNDKRL